MGNMPMTTPPSSAVFERLVEVTHQIAQGDFDKAQHLLAMSQGGEQPDSISRLAESIALMMVKIEGREFQLEQKIEELAESNHRLSESLEKIKILENLKNLLSNFVPDSVKRKVNENPEAPDLERVEKDLTILFLDVASFTSMTEASTSSQINYLIERYFSCFIDDIFKNRGEICESQGDGLMIIFETQEGCSNHTVNAANTALAIQRKVREINADLAEGERAIAVNIGIETGRATVGSTRFEGVAGARWTYTAYGMAVNLASRIGSLARNGQTLVSHHVVEKLSDAFEVRDFGHHRLKNVSGEVSVWELLDAPGQ